MRQPPLALTMIRIQVLFFGGVRDVSGKSEQLLELPEGSRARDACELLCAQLPELRPRLASVRCALNEEFVELDTPLRMDDTLALIPPVSGG